MEWFKKEGIEWIKAIAIGFLVFLIIRTFFFSQLCGRRFINDADVARRK